MSLELNKPKTIKVKDLDNEEIEVRNDCGDKFIVRIENVIYFE